MLGSVATLRELFRAKLGNKPCSEFSSSEITRKIGLPHVEAEHIKEEVQSTSDDEMTENSSEESQNSRTMTSTTSGCISQLNDPADEFFDVPDETECEYENAQEHLHSELSPATLLIKKVHDQAVQRTVRSDLQEPSKRYASISGYGTTLQQDLTSTLRCSWANSDPSAYLVRGETYLRDHRKNSAALGGREFFFVVNVQIPGPTRYNLAYYYMMETPLESVPLLEKFIKGDDAYRNSRFKLIPYISEGPWIVKQSVRKKACLLGQALETNYIEGKNYFEVDIDVGSSMLAKRVASLVLSYFNNVVMEIAFLIQGNTQEELPEFLLGTCRVNNLDLSKAVSVSSSL